MRSMINRGGLVVTALGLGLAATATTGTATAADRDTAAEALAAHPAAALDAAGQAFEARNVVTDPDGTTHTRLDRTYRGLRVLGGDLVVHQAADGDLEGVSQTLDAALDLGTAPTVTAAAARTRGLAARAAQDISGRARAQRPELVVDATGAEPRLAWRVVTGGVQPDGTPSRLASYVDATSGRLIRSEQEIVNADGTGHTLYSGTVPLDVSPASGGYSLTDPVHGGAATYDMGNRTDSMFCQIFGAGCTNGTLVTSSSPTFGDGTNGDRASAAADAHYGAATTWDYFKQTHGRDGIFDNGQGTPSRVHYGNDYVNAFWDGSKMTYGDGDGTSFGPLVSLDVAGHEMSHGVTEHSANLTYSGESGGLNEATSDIFGTMVEFHAGNSEDAGDYLIGEEFDLENHLGFRRMDKPSSDGSSQDCWTAGTGALDVHYSSGVGNHFFYLLAEGSGAKTINGVAHDSPTCDGSTVTGIGRDQAAAIWYRALTVYMTSSTNYAQARTATIDAATDLYGASSTQATTVAAAWDAVNVS